MEIVDFLIWALIGIFAFASIGQALPFLDGIRWKLAQRVVDQLGFLDVYFEACSNESLDMIMRLRHKEMDYREGIIDFMSENLSVPEMLIMLSFGRSVEKSQKSSTLGELSQRADGIAQYYIDIVRSQRGSERTYSDHPSRIYHRRLRRRQS